MENINLENQMEIIVGPTNRKKRAILFCLAGAAAVLILAGLAYAAYEIYMPVNKTNLQAIEFVVEKGQGVKEISWRLQEAELIHSPFWFQAYVWVRHQGSYLQAGKYSLGQNFNMPEIASIITGGKVISNEVKITFPEGFTGQQIKARLIEQGVVAASSLGNDPVLDYQVQYKFLTDAPIETDLEGYFFPDTYIFERDVKKEEIIKKFLDNFDKKLTPDLREAISNQRRTIFEVITLASIVQQESVDETEMPLIAGVFAKRLQLGMALQSDATINFVTGKKDRQPLYEDLKVQSPYNTYLYKGLPPGPICNPGLATIKAAISPQQTDYLYFLHPLNGATVFSKTADEHNRNKAKFLK
ncbi:MAG TPA: endolytic transglycosylase MltG [Candidatus Portnoybacteria bacterium]|nr:endolytic transglycosylase MltG [Candidatus Portnoybacteria bacterium]